MDRKEIKELAKSKIKGNVWKLVWPALVIAFGYSLLSNLLVPKAPTTIDYSNIDAITTQTNMSPTAIILTIILGIIYAVAIIAYQKYILNFAREGKCEFKDILNCMKEKWLNILLATILVAILVSLASMLFVIPGIILALAYTMVPYLVIDTNLGAVDAMKESRRMMKGYKGNFFVFGLSFIGWILLIPFTLGILSFWLIPYMNVAQAIYYDRLKEKTKN